MTTLRRATSRLVALLLASVVCFGASGLGHSGDDDLTCDLVAVHHDHNAHRLRSGTLPAGAPEHCLFCHSFRSLGNGLIATHAPVVDTTQAASIRASNVVLAGRLLDPNAPSRAPPSVLL